MERVEYAIFERGLDDFHRIQISTVVSSFSLGIAISWQALGRGTDHFPSERGSHAIFDATGVRLLEMPMTAGRVKEALAAASRKPPA